MILKNLGVLYKKLIGEIPEMTWIEYAREHWRISQEELEQSQKQADKAIEHMEQTLKARHQEIIKEWKRDTVILEINEIKEKLIKYNKICQQITDRNETLPFDISFHLTLSEEILWRINDISGKTELTTYWRIAWIWNEIIQRLEKIE
jgi:hypothetical protein